MAPRTGGAMIHRKASRGALTASTALLTALLTGCLERELKPLNPCLVSGVVAEVAVSNIEKVDILFMVDNSFSMAEEQTALSREFPKLIKALASGDRDLNGEKDFTPVKDLRLGVVSSDLGLANLAIRSAEACTGNGDDGRLQNIAARDAVGCSQTTYSPPYLTYSSTQGGDPDQLANDFACIAKVGTGGCGLEQQLESALKAVWPGNDPSRVFLTDAMTGTTTTGNAGAGFANGDFIRPDSLIAIVLVTDEEDCSSRNMQHFLDNAAGNLNTTCFFEGQKPAADSDLFSVDRYIEAFKALRPNQPNLVIFAGIVGVPERLVSAQAMSAFDRDDRAQSDAFFDTILADPDMHERIDDQGTADLRDDKVATSCDRGGDDTAKAYPPRRIVEVAKGFGENGVITSICEDDYGAALNAVITKIAGKLSGQCLPRSQQRNALGLVDCRVVEIKRPGDRSPCDPNRGRTSQLDDRVVGDIARMVCEVAQLPVLARSAPAGVGWYYDDFSEEVKACKTDKQRIAFAAASPLEEGAGARFECFRAVTEPSSQTATGAEAINTPCADDGSDGLHGAAKCAALSDPSATLICVNGSCQVGCTSDAQCPAGRVCTGTGGMAGFCENPTCPMEISGT
jgi:hypothetical protein